MSIMSDLGTKIGGEFKAHRLRIEAVESGKQDSLVSGTNIKTINGVSVIGSGDVTITTGAKDTLAITSATVVNVDAYAYNQISISALAENVTFNAPTGMIDGSKLLIRVKDNGTSRVLTWDSIFRGFITTLPTATVVGKTTYIGFIYNSIDTKWDCISVNVGA